MYTIMVCGDNTLRTTQRERIMQRSKLVDKLHFLVPPKYNDLDMSATTVVLEYVTPSKEYAMEILTKSEALYKEYLEYLLPIDTNLTKESSGFSVLSQGCQKIGRSSSRQSLHQRITVCVSTTGGKVNEHFA